MTDAKSKVLEWLRNNPLLFVFAEDEGGQGAQLVERATGKQLAVRWGKIKDVVEKTTPLRPQPYVVLVFEDGRQLALADVGFAFAPSTRNSGPLPELPDVFCFRDLRHLMTGAQNLLNEEGRQPDALRAVMMSIALLDGARDVGFDVSLEEKQLEKILRQIEAG